MDHPLNEQGHLQAQELGRAIQERIGHPVHRLIVSDMIRAKQTASYLGAGLGLPVEVIADFREWHLGEWEGKNSEEFGHFILGDGEPTGGEKRLNFYLRIETAWKNVHSETHPYVIVSHGAVWLAIQDQLKIPRFKINNCQLVKVHSQEGAWRAQII